MEGRATKVLNVSQHGRHGNLSGDTPGTLPILTSAAPCSMDVDCLTSRVDLHYALDAHITGQALGVERLASSVKAIFGTLSLLVGPNIVP